ncbi:MAG TPA: flavin monoamine oxidase family protein [Solirubrobacterales bacterium]|nr:flavin monoamine oxidase family protein [Solirubrobacterales bacterium]
MDEGSRGGAATQLSADVVVVGAGLSGLAAARAIADSGREVVVLEARERVGGRLLNATLGEGVTVDVGGQWVGDDHERVQRLAGELGVETFPQHGAGRNLLDVGGVRRRYRGTIPRLGPRALWDVFIARRRFDRLAAAVEAAAPWAAEQAAELDGQTLAGWIEQNTRTEIARKLLGLAGRTIWGTGPEELSMLHVLFYVNSAGGFDKLIDTEGGAQQDRLDGGAQLLAIGLAESLGDRVRLGAPVRRIEHGGGGVRIGADGLDVEAGRAILALPAALAARIDFDPSLPARRTELARRFRPGRLNKCMALYEEPFWRADGFSGEAVTDAGPVTLTFDSSPRDGSAGVLLGFVGGPDADEMAGMDEAGRRAAVLACFARLYGPRAERPLDYAEQEWSAEEWSGGGPTSNFGPGGWTECGPALRQPVGRIHWAGTETATVWSGYMEGALQAGERAAAEALASPAAVG